MLFNIANIIYNYAYIYNYKVNGPQKYIELTQPLKIQGMQSSVYYLIFDEMTSLVNVEDYYNVDLSDFRDNLSEKGFVIAEDSSTFMPSTYLNMPSNLNTWIILINIFKHCSRHVLDNLRNRIREQMKKTQKLTSHLVCLILQLTTTHGLK